MTGVSTRVLAAVLAGGLGLTGMSAASGAPSAARHGHGIAAVRHATRDFKNLQRAENAGYELFTDAKGIACIAMPHRGGMGVHFVNSGLVAQAGEHIRHPEALVYRIGKTGKLRLAAVEYVVLAKTWHAKHSGAPELFGHKFAFTPAGNRYGLPAFYSLHAWAWYRNPAGRFAPFNPRVHC